MPEPIVVRPLAESDLPEADRIFRLAFGTFLGLPDPLRFAGDADYVRPRFHAGPEGSLAAELQGRLVGSNFATRWGSVGFFGPLSIRPDLWEQRIAQRLLTATMETFERWRTSHVGLFTFAQSPKHVALYQKFGFWPGSLSAVMSRPVSSRPPDVELDTIAGRPADQRPAAIRACRALTEEVYAGLDLGPEIEAVERLALGDTVLVHEAQDVVAFAVCHCGPGTEAGRGICFVKFGAVRPGPEAPAWFDRLLDTCDGLGRSRGLRAVTAGVSMANRAAYRRMLERGFRTDVQGVAMHRPDESGYHVPESWVLGDWR